MIFGEIEVEEEEEGIREDEEREEHRMLQNVSNGEWGEACLVLFSAELTLELWNEQSLTCNRLILSGSTIVLAVMNFIVVVQALSITNSQVLFTDIYLSSYNTGLIVCFSAAGFTIVAVLGFVGSYYRFRNMVKTFIFLTFFFLIFDLVAMVLMEGLANPDQLVVRETEFRDGWIEVVRQIKDGEDTSSKLVAFITEITSSGSCCGYDSLSDKAQNLDVRCTQTATCNSYLNTYIEAQIDSFLSVYTAFFVIGLLDFFILVFFLVRIVPQPVHKEDPGAYYYA